MVTDTDDLLRYITEDPGLSDATKRHYLSKLRVLSEVSDPPGSLEWVLRNADAALTALYNYLRRPGSNRPRRDSASAPASTAAPTKNRKKTFVVDADLSAGTVRAYCVAVSALFMRLPASYLDDIGHSARRDWTRCNDDALLLVRQKYDNWEASDRQRDNFVSWEELIQKRDELGSQAQTRASTSHLLLSLLTYLPPMRTSDLGSLRILHRLPVEWMRGQLETANYVVLYKHYGTITINEYKTAKHYRRIQEKNKTAAHSFVRHDGGGGGGGGADDTAVTRTGRLPTELFLILRESVRQTPRDWVFVDSKGQRYDTENSFNKMVLRTFEKLFDGKAVTVNLVRHAAATWLDANHRHDAPVLRHYRYWMMHGKNMQNEYVLANNMSK